MSRVKKILKDIGPARLIILGFLLILIILAQVYKMSLSEIAHYSLVRAGMNGILVLAMLPAIVSGIGPNFGLPIGVICGLLGGLVAIEMDLTGFTAIFVAILTSIPLGIISGAMYGWLLNRVKGSEMMIATYVGFSVVALMNLGWVLLPFNSPEMKWPIGRGLRVTITLAERFDQTLNNFGAFKIGPLLIPTGLLLAFFFACVAVWLFLRSKSGLAMKAVGDSRQFALASGLNVDRYRLLGTVISNVLGAVGMVVFVQSYGFIQLYEAPMWMGFTAVSSILIGGATVRKANLTHVVVGCFLFQTLLVIALPVANKILTVGGVAEVARIIVSNGVILYALTQVGGAE